MQEITLEVHPRTAEKLAREAAERGYRNRSEYVRQLVLHRSVITSGPPVADQELAEEVDGGSEPANLTTESAGELEEIEARFNARLNELKQRVIALESELENQTEHPERRADS